MAISHAHPGRGKTVDIPLSWAVPGDWLTSTENFGTEHPATEMVRRNKKHVCHIACPGKCSSHVRVSAPCSQHLAQKWSIPGIHFCKFQILPTNWAPPIHPELSTSGGKERGHSPSENHVKSKLAGPKAAPLGGKPVSQSVSQSGLAASGAKLYTNFFFLGAGAKPREFKICRSSSILETWKNTAFLASNDHSQQRPQSN